MFAVNLAEFNRVDDQADVAVPREPHAVMLVTCLVAHAHTILQFAGMAADVEDRGQRLFDFHGPVQDRPIDIRRRQALLMKMELLHDA